MQKDRSPLNRPNSTRSGKSGLNALIQEIKSNVSIADALPIVGINIARVSPDKVEAYCFNHEDKNPSLSISIGKGLYHCFSTGCTVSGDIVSLYQQIFNLSVREACDKIADDFGIDQSQFFESEADPLADLKVNVRRDIDKWQAALFKNTRALTYCRGRGVSDETLRHFRVGFDQSQNALTFPVTNPFDGRTIVHRRMFNVSGPRFLGPNSGDPLKWAGAIFGLDKARSTSLASGSRLGKHLILVEGFFDALALHSAGFTNVVSMLGSSPSKEQIEVITSTHIPTIVCLFDGDKAGGEGAKKLVATCGSQLRVYVADLPNGSDPDDYVKKNGRDRLEALLSSAVPAVDFLIKVAADKVKGGDLYAKTQAISECATSVIRVGGLTGEVGLARLCEEFNVDRNAITDILAQVDSTQSELIEAERRVLAACIKHPENCQAVEAISPPSGLFSISGHNAIFRAISHYAEKRVKEINRDLIEKRLNGAYVSHETYSAIFGMDVSNFEYYLREVRDSCTRRALQGTASKFVGLLKTGRPIQDVVTDHLSNIASNAISQQHVEFSAVEQVESAMEYVHERMASGGKIPGIDLGPNWKQFTELILGFQKRYLYLLAASPKAGKTATVQNWSMQCAVKLHLPTLWINLEMNERDLTLRNLSILSGVSNTRIRTGALMEKEVARITESADRLAKSPYYVVNGGGMSLHEIINTCRKYVYQHGVQIIFLDYIQLIRVKSSTDKAYWEQHAMISSEMKEALTKSLDVPLVAISQLSRGAAMNQSSGAEYMAGAYKYIQDCDCFMGLRRVSQKEAAEGVPGNSVLTVEYNRHGPQDQYVRLMFNTENLQTVEV